MKKYILATLSAITFVNVSAQNQFDAANFAVSDLNGTARYVGMGGALNALGGDISVMSNNPAGTAIYKKSDAAITGSVVFTGESGQLGHDGSRASLDQAGAVFTLPQVTADGKGLQYINFGVNYQKKRNFLGNTQAFLAFDGVESQTNQFADFINAGKTGMTADLGPQTLIYDEVSGEYSPMGATQGEYRRATYGYTGQYDFNISFNVSNQFFFGASLGIYDLTSKRESYYWEKGVDGNSYDFANWYNTEGAGFDIKLGMIFRPIKESPFRFGLTVHTPTWYRLEDINDGGVAYNGGERIYPTYYPDYYEYDFRTPWKFGFSLGHTIGKNFAIGAEYEISDLSSCKYSSIDWDNDQYFDNMNDYISEDLKTQHTLKLGMEYKPADNFAIRFGYNYVSAPLKDSAWKSPLEDGYSCETDYTNWKGTNRFTAGLGYRFNGGYFDLAYQYQAQKGDFYAFTSNNLAPKEINNNRSQLMATLGFRF